SQALTEDGQSYYSHCVKALAELQVAEAAMSESLREPSGRLRISMPVLLGRRLLAPVLLALAARHPALSLELVFSDKVVNLVEDGFDLAVRTGTLEDSAGLSARRLGRQTLVLCASPGYLMQHGTPQQLDALSQHQTLVYGRGPALWRFTDANGHACQVRVHSRIQLDDLETLQQAAEAGLGIVRLPHWLAGPALAAGRLQAVLPQLTAEHRDVQVIWPHNRQLSPRVRVAIDALAAAIPTQLGAA
ncbi:MAG: LysR substrate-binding domain-containing protein, partial [Gammaproteobacteria bacterium]|nr:LysR substrate-binding domain-containing protein [Gammaproteobacteria bacterium]